jgi:hypothetical protein
MHDLLQRFCDESAELKKFLSDQGQLTLVRAAEDNSRKALILCAASLFEHRITEALLSYTERVSRSDGCITALVRIKAIKRQYHSFFEWETKKAGPFFALLGKPLGERLKTQCSVSPAKDELESFLELGYLRNCLVHQNFAEYVLDSTGDEVRMLCEGADNFVKQIEYILS